MRRLLYSSVLFVLFGVGVASQRASNAAPEGKGAAADRPRYVIKPGVGIDGLEIGMTRKAAYEFLGYREEMSRGTPSLNESPWKEDNSLSCKLKEGRVSEIRFNFRGTSWPFDGVTDKGIGRQSTVHDMIRKYGERKRNGVPTPSRTYWDLGIHFAFNNDGDLWYILVFAPERTPKKD